MCYTQSMTENMVEQKETPMRRNSCYRLWKWLLGSIAALKEATVAIPEDAVAGPEGAVAGPEGAVAGPEGAVNTSGAQASGKNAERSYEVVAVIPIELFTSHNLDTVRRSIQNNKMVCCEDLTGRNKIERYIQQFSAYDYKIYHLLTTAKIIPVDVGEEDVAFNPLKLQAVASICEQLPYQVLYLSTRLNVGRKL